jgi:hypothetical protein
MGKRRHGELLTWLREHFDADDTDECYSVPWRKGITTVRWQGKNVLVYALVCEWQHGPRPVGLEVCHSCGHGHLGCINRRHVRWDTHLNNVREKVAHGTEPRGECRLGAKLTADQVRAIRIDPRPHRVIAAEFGVMHGVIGGIKRGERWTHVQQITKQAIRPKRTPPLRSVRRAPTG